MPTDLSSIYVHDGTLVAITNDHSAARITFHADLPVDPWGEALARRDLVFEGVTHYQEFEGLISGDITLLDLSIISEENAKIHIRIDTTAGRRELVCDKVFLKDA
jgi:hypothetical protein